MQLLHIAINKILNTVMYFLVYFSGAFVSTRFFLWAQSAIDKLEIVSSDKLYLILTVTYIIIGGIGFLVILKRQGFNAGNQPLSRKILDFFVYGFFSGLIFLAVITFGYLR